MAGAPPVASHTHRESSEIEAKSFPSGDHARSSTALVCSLGSRFKSPDLRSQTSTDPSACPEARRAPSGDHASHTAGSSPAPNERRSARPAGGGGVAGGAAIGGGGAGASVSRSETGCALQGIAKEPSGSSEKFVS